MAYKNKRWDEVEQVLDQLLAVPQPQRDQRLKELSRTDPPLYKELAKLLAAMEESGDFMQSPGAWRISS